MTTTAPRLDTPVGGHRLGDLTSLRDHPLHPHTTDDLVGYIVRRTIDAEGRVEWHDDTRTACGVDVAVFDGPNLYAEALEHARLHRAGQGWAAVDMVYACGCRS